MEHREDPDPNRNHDRLPLVADVTVTMQPKPVRGSGRNISRAGVYFIADEEIRAIVRIGDREVEATVVRLEKHDAGHTGIAVRFDEGAFDLGPERGE